MTKSVEAVYYYTVRRAVCPHCSSFKTIIWTVNALRPRWFCNNCKRTFYLSSQAKSIGEINELKDWRTKRIKILCLEEKKGKKKQKVKKNANERENNSRK